MRRTRCLKHYHVDPPATMINSAGDYVVSYIVSRFVEGKDWLQKQLNNA